MTTERLALNRQPHTSAASVLTELFTLFPAAEWHEDHGDVLWWYLDPQGKVCEAPIVGNPLDSEWDESDMSMHRHWSRIPNIEGLGALPPFAETPAVAPVPCKTCGDTRRIPITSLTAAGAWDDCPECGAAVDGQVTEVPSSAHRFGVDPRRDPAFEASGTGFEIHPRDVERMRAKQEGGNV
jgi:hypothetical protein